MLQRIWSLGVIVVLLCGVAIADQKAPARNPFGLADVPDIDGPDVKQFRKVRAKDVNGGAKDANAVQWVKKATPGKVDSLEGEWSSRWNGPKTSGGAGPAEIRVVGDRIYVLYTDEVGKSKGTKTLLEARREGNKVIGRWAIIGDEKNQNGPYYGIVVNNERIDGTWYFPQFRWNFRRNLAK